VVEEVAGVADMVEGAEGDVEAVGDEAEAGEELEEASELGKAVFCCAKHSHPEQEWGDSAEDWSGPGDEEGVWVFGEVGAGEGIRVRAKHRQCWSDCAGHAAADDAAAIVLQAGMGTGSEAGIGQ